VCEYTRRSAGDPATVARGGAFGFDALVSQLTNRVVVHDRFRGLYAGVRICATPR